MVLDSSIVKTPEKSTPEENKLLLNSKLKITEPLKNIKFTLKNNKYYKKYLKYKTLANDLHKQAKNVKDKAIASLVEKEK
jgi:hypothetical protein